LRCGDEVRHGLGSELSDDLLRCHRESGARGDEKSLAIQGMSRIVDRDKF